MAKDLYREGAERIAAALTSAARLVRVISGAGLEVTEQTPGTTQERGQQRCPLGPGGQVESERASKSMPNRSSTSCSGRYSESGAWRLRRNLLQHLRGEVGLLGHVSHHAPRRSCRAAEVCGRQETGGSPASVPAAEPERRATTGLTCHWRERRREA